MTDYLSIEEIRNIQYKINQKIEEIELLKRMHKEKMDKCNNNINYLKKILYKNCKHNKVIDYDNIDEHTHYCCSICYMTI